MARFVAASKTYLKPGMFGEPLPMTSARRFSWPPSDLPDKSGPKWAPPVIWVCTWQTRQCCVNSARPDLLDWIKRILGGKWLRRGELRNGENKQSDCSAAQHSASSPNRQRYRTEGRPRRQRREGESGPKPREKREEKTGGFPANPPAISLVDNAKAFGYFRSACALSAARSASLRNVMTATLLVRE